MFYRQIGSLNILRCANGGLSLHYIFTGDFAEGIFKMKNYMKVMLTIFLSLSACLLSAQSEVDGFKELFFCKDTVNCVEARVYPAFTVVRFSDLFGIDTYVAILGTPCATEKTIAVISEENALIIFREFSRIVLMRNSKIIFKI